VIIVYKVFLERTVLYTIFAWLLNNKKSQFLQ